MESFDACRACLKIDQNKNEWSLLSAPFGNGMSYGQIYQQYIGYNNWNSIRKLPHSICTDCKKVLQNFYEFNKQCRCNEAKYLNLPILGIPNTENTTRISNEVPKKYGKFTLISTTKLSDLLFTQINDRRSQRVMIITDAAIQDVSVVLPERKFVVVDFLEILKVNYTTKSTILCLQCNDGNAFDYIIRVDSCADIMACIEVVDQFYMEKERADV